MMLFELSFQVDVCLPTALGCHLMEAETSVHRRFWAAFGQAIRSTKPTSYAFSVPAPNE
ncbi:hypothetical protein M2232_009266 [Bradyrhizobium japonicum]|uniref:hypothetical protein n=1 Tax=Bradyrhizobium japonicum TaxID=375 RepID=UPI002226D582|nr:hypothetical protein [Bradyrhizobium japonicum]MCW2225734.1 hypothetical protein [Bradyrhizobium japonicum]MCW2340946.1 hypothetical protein [Bradyrhizobium japonicum]